MLFKFSVVLLTIVIKMINVMEALPIESSSNSPLDSSLEKHEDNEIQHDLLFNLSVLPDSKVSKRSSSDEDSNNSMQSDQTVISNDKLEIEPLTSPTANFPFDSNFFNMQQIEANRNKRDNDEDSDDSAYFWLNLPRTDSHEGSMEYDGVQHKSTFFQQMFNIKSKNIRLESIKNTILRQTGRDNTTLSTHMQSLNFTPDELTEALTTFQNQQNKSIIDESFHFVRSYYPVCQIPRNTEADAWKDDNTMNLYFMIDPITEDNATSFASATLRLYRLPKENSTTSTVTVNTETTSDISCENSSSDQDDKLVRVSIYWYTKALKKHRVKRRLSDSKVVEENADWVELSVKPATKAWSRGRNLGMAVVVEDQEGNALRAERYFKGASCTVGESIPKPFPTFITDAIRQTSKNNGSNDATGTNSTTAYTNNLSLLPIISVCTIQFSPNLNSTPLSTRLFHSHKCNTHQLQFEARELRSKEKQMELLPIMARFPISPRLRHQHKHPHDNSDQRITNGGHFILVTREELEQMQLNRTSNTNR